MALNPNEFYDATICRLIDMDGYPKSQPYQCVDLFKAFCFYQLGFSTGSLCQSTGYARDIWYDFEKLGLNKYFEKAPVNMMFDGDWAIWDFSKTSPYSHIAMFRWDNKNGTGQFLGQNQRGIPVSQVAIPYSGLLGALRPKVYYVAYKNNYECLGDMYVRWDASYNAGIKLVKNLTEDGKAHATSSNPNSYAIYKKGTIFTAVEEKDKGYGLWGRSPSGWVCIKGQSGKDYCRKI